MARIIACGEKGFRTRSVPFPGVWAPRGIREQQELGQRRKVMGEILEIASWVGTPIGAVTAVAFVVALYFFGRWVLTD